MAIKRYIGAQSGRTQILPTLKKEKKKLIGSMDVSLKALLVLFILIALQQGKCPMKSILIAFAINLK